MPDAEAIAMNRVGYNSFSHRILQLVGLLYKFTWISLHI